MKTTRAMLVTVLAGTVALAVPFHAVAAGSPGEGTVERRAGRAGEYIDDTIVTARVKAAVTKVDGVRATDVQVETRNGVVQLSGFVDSQSAKDEAVLAAQHVEGVRELKNAIEVRPRK